jgi:transposase-like protein
MSRLSESDKQQIVELYRQPGETTLTLADRYGVSNTTISRILKSTLSADEYDRLIQQKRGAGRGRGASVESPGQGSLLDAPVTEGVEESVPVKVTRVVVDAPVRRSRRRTSVAEPELESSDNPGFSEPVVAEPIEEILREELATSRNDLLDEEEDLDDLEDDLEEGLDDDDDDDGDDEGNPLPSIHLNAAEFIQVLPLAEAAIPRVCYLVVDRSAELVVRPLQEFAELGQIPSAEIQERTLPIFDNHRVAKRFSNIRTQRVIKVPDSRVLQKAAPHLQAKGITRLLIDGQVYAL